VILTDSCDHPLSGMHNAAAPARTADRRMQLTMG
jgi:hypothetical protein